MRVYGLEDVRKRVLMALMRRERVVLPLCRVVLEVSDLGPSALGTDVRKTMIGVYATK